MNKFDEELAGILALAQSYIDDEQVLRVARTKAIAAIKQAVATHIIGEDEDPEIYGGMEISTEALDRNGLRAEQRQALYGDKS